MRTVLVVLLLLLAGCAASQKQLRMEMVGKSNIDLCLLVVTSQRYRNVAMDELESREHQCDWELAKAQAQVSARNSAQRDAIAQQLLRQSGPQVLVPPPAPSQPRMVNCTSYRDATGAIQTNCF